MNGSGSLLRVIALALVVVGFWFAGRYGDNMPAPRGLDAPSTEFSAARASATLARLLGPEVPHPVSTAANQAVRDRVRAAFAALGVKTSLYRATGCNGRAKYGFFACGTVEDILAEVAPGAGKAIVLLAHYDSVPAGPGASDDQSGVATVIETVRALKARGLKTRHPILAVITDGEEAGLLGADAFVENPALRAGVGVVVNVEARGNNGPSLLFQTSPGDGPLVDLYDRSTSAYATSSLFSVIYKALPNDTDLTMFLNAGLTGFNFAFSGNVAHYHTSLDRRANLDPSTLQMHGDNMLGIASALEQTDFAALSGGHDDVYLTVLGRFIPRLPAAWALPLAIAALLMLVGAAFLSRGEVLGIGRRLAAFSIPLVVVLGAAASGWLLHEVASLVSGQPDPSFAHPVWLRVALGFGVLAIVILVSRVASARMTALSVWGWFSVLAVGTAAFLPGLSPYFLFPALAATPLLLAQSRLSSAWTGAVSQALLFLAALPALLIWLALTATGESIQGLFLHPLFTVPAAFGAMTLLPLLAARPLPRSAWLLGSVGAVALALGFAVTAGLQPPFSSWQPQRLNIVFVDDHVANKGQWAVQTVAPVPAPLRAIMPFSAQPADVTPLVFQKMYVAPAAATRFNPPSADAVIVPNGAGRIVTLRLHASAHADRVVIVVPKDAGLARVELRGKTFLPAADSLNPAGTIIACVTDDCRTMTVKLTFSSRARVPFTLGEQEYGVPPDGAKLIRARPATAVASQFGDTTIVFGKLTL
ncbi:MAG TPA: M20/M25/M40 family metallo-hydrolase [Rhizomicrobium sp.]|nr:M20/M25/M40 family metallo-hydrolase [Rhizomicrobium sp.]